MLQKITVIPNTTKNLCTPCCEELFRRLLSSGAKIELPEAARPALPFLTDDCGADFVSADRLYRDSQLIIVLGGDGSVIDTARAAAHFQIPITGINFGTVGYLAEIGRDEPELIERLLWGDFQVEDRVMLDISIASAQSTAHFTALNEATISNGPITRLMDMELLCDGVPAEVCRANGLVIATPTGSTGYSLSAGGPVLDPRLDCFCITPVCPHLLKNRPFILNSDSVLELRAIRCVGNTIYLSCDGRDVMELRTDSVVTIRKSSAVTKLVRLRRDGFLGVLNRKMWGDFNEQR